jgi:hypothetical protein
MKHKQYHLYQAIFVGLLIVLLTCASCKSVGGNNASSPASAAISSSTPSSSPSKRLIKEAGWRIPGIGAAKEFLKPTLLQAASSESVKVYSTWLRPQSSNNSGPVTLKEYLSDEELKELGVPEQRPQVMTIVKYDLGDRPFCYVVKYRATYTMEGLHYYDEDGDKLFELVERGTPSPDFIPRIPQTPK